MATQSHQSTSAILVGNAFVSQYYNVLHQQPESVHKFFTDASKMLRGESDLGGAMKFFNGQQEIHKKIMSIGFHDVKAEIKSVDSMESLEGGVLVMVTGFLWNKGEEKRSFVQSFFLAPQEKGYFVLSDIFRYLDEDTLVKHAMTPNGINQTYNPQEVQHQGLDTSPEPDIREVSVDQTSQDAEHENINSNNIKDVDSQTISENIEVQQIEYNDEVDQVEEQPVVEITQPPQPSASININTVNVEQTSSSQAEPTKKSYASIVSAAKNSLLKGMSQTQVIPNGDHQVESTPLPHADESLHLEPQEQPNNISHSQTSLSPPPPASTSEDAVNDTAADSGDGGRSVYLKNLPFRITTHELLEIMKQFGPINVNNVQVRTRMPNVCFGFIEYMDASSAANAVQKSVIQVRGQNVKIEKKLTTTYFKPGTFANNRNRGGGGYARGGERFYRNDGMRGRGQFVAGRTGFKPQNFDKDQNELYITRGRSAGAVANRNNSFPSGSQRIQNSIGNSENKSLEKSSILQDNQKQVASGEASAVAHDGNSVIHEVNGNLRDGNFRGNRRGGYGNFGNRSYPRNNPQANNV